MLSRGGALRDVIYVYWPILKKALPTFARAKLPFKKDGI